MEAWRFGSLVFGEGLRPTPLLLSFKREDDGGEGTISGRSARKATGVSPSGFARTGVFAGKGDFSISPDTIEPAPPPLPRRGGFGTISPMAKDPDGLTPMMRQYRRTKEELDADTILFFRMGDFYEMFFEDAHRAAPILGVAVTKRAGVPMCGVPYHALDNYLAKVIRAGLKAAVCEQAEDPKTAKGLVRREITRIVSPGSLTEDALLDAEASNYIAAVFSGKGAYGVAALELSTGTLAVEDAHGEASLIEALRRIAPSETVVADDQRDQLAPTLPASVSGPLTATDAWRFMADQATDTLTHQFNVHSLEGYCGQGPLPQWVRAAGALLGAQDGVFSGFAVRVKGAGVDFFHPYIWKTILPFPSVNFRQFLHIPDHEQYFLSHPDLSPCRKVHTLRLHNDECIYTGDLLSFLSAHIHHRLQYVPAHPSPAHR